MFSKPDKPPVIWPDLLGNDGASVWASVSPNYPEWTMVCSPAGFVWGISLRTILRSITEETRQRGNICLALTSHNTLTLQHITLPRKIFCKPEYFLSSVLARSWSSLFPDVSVPPAPSLSSLHIRRICGNILSVWALTGNFYIIFSRTRRAGDKSLWRSSRSQWGENVIFICSRWHFKLSSSCPHSAGNMSLLIFNNFSSYKMSSAF